MRRWCVVGRGRLVAALVTMIGVAAISTMAPGGPPAARGQQPEDPALLRELAERLLSPPVPLPTGEVPRVRLLPGALPAELPFELPLPPGSRLIGSTVGPSFAGGPEPVPSGLGITAVLDAPGTAADIFGFYRSALGGRGWFEPAFGPFDGRPPGGFLPSFPITSSSAFCSSPRGPWLFVAVRSQASGPSDVRIHVETGTPGPCGGPPGPGRPPSPEPPGFELLPPLTAPPGVQVAPRGSGGGDDFVESRAIAVTDMRAADLEAHYAQQLAAAGWTRLAGSVEGPVAWSVWAVPGEGNWHGFLFVLEVPGESRRSLHLEVASAARAGAGREVRLVPVP